MYLTLVISLMVITNNLTFKKEFMTVAECGGGSYPHECDYWNDQKWIFPLSSAWLDSFLYYATI